MKVEVVEYAGAWLALPPDQRTRIGAGGVFCQLGVDAAAGVRAWNPEARILLRVGPLSRDGFERLLPDGAILYRLVSLVRAFVGIELGFAVNPVLTAAEVAPLQLDSRSTPPPRLGWNTWLPIAGGSATRPADAADAVFDADMVEAWTLANRRVA
jgi:type VI secretion system protein ImpH